MWRQRLRLAGRHLQALGLQPECCERECRAPGRKRPGRKLHTGAANAVAHATPRRSWRPPRLPNGPPVGLELVVDQRASSCSPPATSCPLGHTTHLELVVGQLAQCARLRTRLRSVRGVRYAGWWIGLG